MHTIRILLVEDEFVVAEDLKRMLRKRRTGPVGLAFSVAEAVASIEADRPDLVLLDIMLQGERTGIELGQQLTSYYQIPFIYVTSHSDKQTLQRAVATQPSGYIVKPFQEDEVLAAIEVGLAQATGRRLVREQAFAPGPGSVAALPSQHHIVGEDPAMQRVLTQVRQVAPVNMTALLLGETGTGKELLARAVHDLSPRRNQPLVTVNCAALPPQLIESELFGHEKGAFTGAHERRLGKFELADGGTIFLDEIGELPLELQVKLLRVLQEKEIDRLGGKASVPLDVRVVAATNRDLQAEVAAGRFRSDLYYRLHVLPITIPPLRERPRDIRGLAEFFLRRVSEELARPPLRFSPQALAQLQQYSWPGNVRELQHTVERAAIFTSEDVIQHVDLSQVLPPEAGGSSAAGSGGFQPQTLEEAERQLITATLKHCQGRIRGPGGAAEYLRILPNTLDARIRRLGIQRNYS
ncbi:sigma-54-dependent transcriptional regulator [Hymenobacter weizhouensis]|uniref:sigma-54-dependent transcriptional regulator n=1 Tax=Hymenobacter sp. YIM 151500-1 TaxID=2987689 RepID=UPI0022270500|nr:sigma-54 dependent transcriptional regulator [Hymenobacter sp. YIM 151500-1]UYZ63348.1 sigma-54 dependent transcriptional regulator [Hymenobacter sp. YIM 151500-1]